MTVDSPATVECSPLHGQPTTLDGPADHSTDENSDAEEMYYPILSGCRNVNDFEKMNKIEEGTYGLV